MDRYFADEREKVSTYNNRRGELIAKASSLNSAIEDWNKKGRIRWERYVAELKEMEDAELRAFQTAAELYIKACKEERSYFQPLSEGYQQGEKQCVIERLGFVLDRITLPRSLPHTWEIDFDDEQRIAVIDIVSKCSLPPFKKELPEKRSTRPLRERGCDQTDSLELQLQR